MNTLATGFLPAALCLALTLGSPLTADPLDRKQVPADAKWVLHLDAALFQKTKVGSAFLEKVLDQKSAQGKADLKRELDFDLDWRSVQSVTAYGLTLQAWGKPDPTGLLLIQTTLAVQPALEKAAARSLPALRVEKIEAPAGPLYLLNDNACIGFARNGLVLVAKDREAVDKGLSVLRGTAPSLAGSPALAGYPETTHPAFFIAMVEGLGQQTELPPKAALLKQAQSARLTAAEAGDQLQLSLTLRTTSPEVAQQIQQVVQGLIALVSLSDQRDPNLLKLAQAAAASTDGSALTVRAALPVSDVLQKLGEAR